VKSRPLAPGDLVLRKVVGIAKNPAWAKLGLNWERPYRITFIASVGTYHLEDLDENVIHRPWNVNNLQRYYYSLFLLSFISCLVVPNCGCICWNDQFEKYSKCL